jgi:hypothetical protein
MVTSDPDVRGTSVQYPPFGQQSPLRDRYARTPADDDEDREETRCGGPANPGQREPGRIGEAVATEEPVRLDDERLRELTLARQFPAAAARSAADVVALVRRVGPIQSQSPRAPFAALAARLPGVDHATITSAFESYDLIKNPTLRRTVHTVAAAHFPYVDAVAERTSAGPMTAYLRLRQVDVAEVRAETERYCRQWRDRDDLVRHVQRWLAERDEPEAAARIDTPAGANHIWAHSGVLRRPTDGRWERRTDTLHRAARELVDVARLPAADALVGLVRIHLAAHGPATRRDVAWWSGETLTRVDAAVSSLGEEVVRQPGPDGQDYLDLAGLEVAEAAPAGSAGTRLLPEFDALVCGYAPAGRARFVTERHSAAVAARQHRDYSPLVLLDGRPVGTWRLVTQGARRHLEVVAFPGERAPRSDGLDDAAAALARALDLVIDDVRPGGP